MNEFSSSFQHGDTDLYVAELVGSKAEWSGDHATSAFWNGQEWYGQVHEYHLVANPLAESCFVVRCRDHVHTYAKDGSIRTPEAAVQQMLKDRACLLTGGERILDQL